MLRLLLILSALLALPLHHSVNAADAPGSVGQSSTMVWKSDEFGVAAHIPISAGWAPIAPPEIPGLTVLVAMQNPSRGAVFGVNVVNNVPKANLRDPATVKSIEDSLRGFQYQFIGNSFVTIGGAEWRQYNVKSIAPGQAASGVVRYTAANGRIFGVTILLSGGKEAAQDLELQTSAGSVRFYVPVGAAVAAQPAEPKAAPAPAENARVADAKPAAAPQPEKKETKADEPDYVRIGIIASGAIIAILVLLKLIGGGGGGANLPPKRR